jgi:hypothetical protein
MSFAPHERDAQEIANHERTPQMARKTTTRSANSTASSTDATTNATSASASSAPLSGFAKGAPALTLADLAARYLAHMAEQGKSDGTRFSYGMELKLAQAELGSDALVSYLTPESIALFNEAPRVTTLKSGRPKSQLSIDKTRRVLRLALTWAHQEGLIDHAVVDPKKDALRADPAGAESAKGARGKRAASKDEKGKLAKDAKAAKSPKRSKPAADAPATISCSVCRATFTPSDEFANACPDCAKAAEQEAALDAQPTATDAQQDAPSEQPIATEERAAQRAPRASKKRRGATTLEVSQVEAEAAARDAEQQIAVASVPQEEASAAQ